MRLDHCFIYIYIGDISLSMGLFMIFGHLNPVSVDFVTIPCSADVEYGKVVGMLWSTASIRNPVFKVLT